MFSPRRGIGAHTESRMTILQLDNNSDDMGAMAAAPVADPTLEEMAFAALSLQILATSPHNSHEFR